MTTPPATSLVPGWTRVGPCEYARTDLPGYRIIQVYDGFEVFCYHRPLGFAPDPVEAAGIVSANAGRW